MDPIRALARRRLVVVVVAALLVVSVIPIASLASTSAAPPVPGESPFIAVELRPQSGEQVSAPPTFTGEVSNDFNPALAGYRKVDDPGGVGDVGVPPVVSNKYYPSGWDMQDIRFYYDEGADVLYVGINYPNSRIEGPAGPVIAGDADSDGDPGGTSAELAQPGIEGTDLGNLAGSESICLAIDTDESGLANVIVGVSGELEDINDFKVANFVGGGGMSDPWKRFGAEIVGAVHTAPTNPSGGWPDFEFAIADFSTMPGLPADWNVINFLAFSGSQEDDGIGEDYFQAQMGRTPTPTPTSQTPTPTPPTVTPYTPVVGGSTIPTSVGLATPVVGYVLISLAGLIAFGAFLILRRKR